MAFRAFFALLGGSLPEDIARACGYTKSGAEKKPSPAAPAVKTTDGALQLLGLLQKEARLLDFFMEDIAPYSDEQVGAAVRNVHAQTQDTLRKVLKLAPVVDSVEGTYVKLESLGALGRDPAAVKFIGNLPAQGKPAGGTLRHRGWRADSVDLPAVSGKQNLMILGPAELEVE